MRRGAVIFREPVEASRSAPRERASLAKISPQLGCCMTLVSRRQQGEGRRHSCGGLLPASAAHEVRLSAVAADDIPFRSHEPTVALPHIGAADGGGFDAQLDLAIQGVCRDVTGKGLGDLKRRWKRCACRGHVLCSQGSCLLG